jgi:hypothetical protein
VWPCRRTPSDAAAAAALAPSIAYGDRNASPVNCMGRAETGRPLSPHKLAQAGSESNPQQRSSSSSSSSSLSSSSSSFSYNKTHGVVPALQRSHRVFGLFCLISISHGAPGSESNPGQQSQNNGNLESNPRENAAIRGDFRVQCIYQCPHDGLIRGPTQPVHESMDRLLANAVPHPRRQILPYWLDWRFSDKSATFFLPFFAPI